MPDQLHRRHRRRGHAKRHRGGVHRDDGRGREPVAASRYGSGVAYFADYFYPELQVLHILPAKVQIVSLSHREGQPVTSRFGGELRFWEGTLQPDGTITGSWL